MYKKSDPTFVSSAGTVCTRVLDHLRCMHCLFDVRHQSCVLTSPEEQGHGKLLDQM